MESNMQSEIKMVSVKLIDSNPYRDLKAYPWGDKKLTELQDSYEAVGMWEGVIAREVDGRYQTAFGHHRMEAARRNKLDMVPLIVRPLSEEMMLKFMGRENGEDYQSNFLVMLNAWEAAVKYFAARARQKQEPLDVAVLLGWTEGKRDGYQMNHTARACNAAAALIAGGHHARNTFAGLTTDQAERICVAEFNRMQQAEKLLIANKVTATQIASAKSHIAKGAEKTIKQVKAKDVATNDIRTKLDINTYQFARASKERTPLFAMFGDILLRQIERMLNDDNTAEKLAEVRKALPDITENADRQIVQKIDLALGQLGDRAEDWRRKLADPKKKVVNLKAVR
jgi:hypothetical protein